MLVSVIIPVYNVEDYLKECLDSITNQTYQDIEIILVDDGSTDRSGEICEAYAQRDNRIKVFHVKNGGQAAARNYGIDNAIGNYIIFLDSDDVVSTSYVEELYRLVAGTSNTLGVTQITRNQEEVFKLQETIKPIKRYSGESRIHFILSKNSNEPVSKIYPKYFFDAIRFPIGEVYEDMAIAVFVANKAEHIVYKEIPTYFYRTREGSTMNTKITEKNLVMLRQLEMINCFITKEFPQLAQEAAYFSFLQLRGLYLSTASKEILDILWKEMVFYRQRFMDSRNEERKFLGEVSRYWKLYSTYIGKSGTKILFGTYLRVKRGFAIGK